VLGLLLLSGEERKIVLIKLFVNIFYLLNTKREGYTSVFTLEFRKNEKAFPTQFPNSEYSKKNASKYSYACHHSIR